MKIRTRLALGFLVLAIVPLAGIVLYTYVSSLGTVRRALEAEAAALARDMDERMASVREDLQGRLERVAPPSWRAEEGGEQGFVARVLREIAPVAPLVESLEFLPADVAGAAAAEAPAVVAVPAPPPAREPPVAPPVFREPLRVDVQDILRRAEAAGRPLPAEARRELESGAAAVAREATEIAAAARLALALPGQLDEVELERRIEAFVAQAEEQAKVGFRLAEAAERRAAADAERRALAAEPPSAAIGGEDPVVEESLADAPALPADGALPAPPPSQPPGPAAAPIAALVGSAPRSAPRALAVPSHDPAVCEVSVPVREDGEIVGHVRASLAAGVLDRLLAQVGAEEGDVPFVVDAGGSVHLRKGDAAERLAGVELGELAGVAAGGERVIGDWVVATAHDEETGLTFGVARPMGGALAEVRQSAARNFAFGLGFVALAGLAVPALSRRMTRQVGVLTDGAARIARGDLTTRLPVQTDDEIGQLAAAFNHMARDLSEHQARLLAEELRRQQRESEERLLRADHARKSAELEEARAFQLSLLPRTLPAGDGFELAVFTRTAAEVGGDFYDFQLAGDGTLTVAVGDATGHGARAGTMVAVTKSLFAGYDPVSGPAEFLGRAAGAVRRMELGRMTVALLLARLSPPGEGARRLTVATAGMPPVLVRRVGGGGEAAVDEFYAPGMPLGGLDTAYAETTLEVAAGDTILLTTDGFPELADRAGDPLGYGEVRRLLATAPEGAPDAIARHLAAAVAARTAGGPPNDDVTFVVVRVR